MSNSDDLNKSCQGWHERRIGDEIELCYGKTLIESKRENGPFPVYGSNGLIGFHNKFYYVVFIEIIELRISPCRDPH
jgi:type I restriction enzyme S subunit